MRILLAPSEGKTPGTNPAPLDLGALTYPQLGPARAEMIRALQAVSQQPDALAVLGVGARVAPEVAANISLDTAPTAPAYQIYSGVAFAAAKLGEIPQSLAPLRIISGLFGIVGATDMIPAYRLAMGKTLPEVGNNTTFWRAHLKPVLDADMAGQLVLDCRSGAYQKPWVSGPDSEVVTTTIRRRDESGKVQVVSHHAKYWRGLIARACLDACATTGTEIAEVADLAAVVATLPSVRDVAINAHKNTFELVVEAS